MVVKRLRFCALKRDGRKGERVKYCSELVFPYIWFKERNYWKWDVIELQISTEKDKRSFQIYSCSGFQGLLLNLEIWLPQPTLGMFSPRSFCEQRVLL